MKNSLIGFFIGVILTVSISSFALYSGYFGDGWKKQDWTYFIHDAIEDCEVDEFGEIVCL